MERRQHKLEKLASMQRVKFTYPFVVLTLSQMSIITAQSSVVFISLVAFSETNKTKIMFLGFSDNISHDLYFD